MTPEVARKYNLLVKQGAYVTNGQGEPSVVSGSSAEKAGIKDKDIITKVGDLEVGDHGSLASLVSEYAVGDTVQLTILRGGKMTTVNIVLQPYTSPN